VSSFAEIHGRLEPLRQALLDHPLYLRMQSIDALRVFMQHHVFAVWDFMSLLKALQLQLCSVEVPWLPPINREGCRLVNEIVLAEESDEDGNGGFASHFDLYYQSMQGCSADTRQIDQFLLGLRQGLKIEAALQVSSVPSSVQDFVQHTFKVIDGGDLCEIASAFAFGREDLLPDLFRQIVDQLSSTPGTDLAALKYYLERHIDLDGDQHGPMAGRLVEFLCGDDPVRWQAAEAAAVGALKARLQLWNGIEHAVAELPR
jgi:hypothetical protein